jgi:alkylation response protein AidB-like acyl-CoA dehydrogenase
MLNEPGDAGIGGDWNVFANDEFRAVIRAFFERYYPPERRYMPRRPRWHEIKDWYLTLSKHGWIAPAWPKEYGGTGLSPEKLLIFFEEQERWGVARTPDHGINMVGPILMRHGTTEQREFYLPRILSGEHIWCQGYSEPGAGSDLAALRTEAVVDGDHFVVNGQKIWTTLAQDATHIFFLVRTDKAAKKQKGISFLLADCKTPGITIRPIRNIAGNEEFNEVFLDNVRVPLQNLVGGMHDGWSVAKSLLWFERLNAGSPKRPQYVLNKLALLAEKRGLFGDPGFTDKFTQLRLDVADLASMYARFAGAVSRGETLGPEVAMLKIVATETLQRLTELAIEAAVEEGPIVGEIELGNATIDVLSLYYNARQTTIAGGSSEIQRNILAKNVLGLPTT